MAELLIERSADSAVHSIHVEFMVRPEYTNQTGIKLVLIVTCRQFELPGCGLADWCKRKIRLHKYT